MALWGMQLATKSRTSKGTLRLLMAAAEAAVAREMVENFILAVL